MHLRAVLLGVGGEFAYVVVQVRQNMVADIGRMLAEFLPVVHFGYQRIALAGDNVLRCFDGVMLERVGKRPVDTVL